MSVSFGLLGPVQALVDGVAVPVSGRHTQAPLAALLLERDGVVPTDRLIDVVWGEAAPANARVQVQNRAAGLRRLLRDADTGAGDLMQTQGSGYRLRLPAGRGQLDVDVLSMGFLLGFAGSAPSTSEGAAKHDTRDHRRLIGSS
jgi:DNA-binding SARP family transcriptional activator